MQECTVQIRIKASPLSLNRAQKCGEFIHFQFNVQLTKQKSNPVLCFIYHKRFKTFKRPSTKSTMLKYNNSSLSCSRHFLGVKSRSQLSRIYHSILCNFFTFQVLMEMESLPILTQKLKNEMTNNVHHAKNVVCRFVVTSLKILQCSK